MKALWLDYQQEQPGRQRPGLVLLISGVLLTALLVGQYFAASAEIDTLSTQVATLQQEAENRRLLASADSLQQENDAAQATARSGGMASGRWESLFATLEMASDDSMTLLTLEPDPKQILITGEAKNLAAAVAYVQRLQSATAFTHARLTEFETIREHPYHPVKFTLLADWREAL